TFIYVNFTFIIRPRNSKKYGAFRLYHTLQQLFVGIFFVFFNKRDYCFGNLGYRLKKFRFIGIEFFDFRNEILYTLLHWLLFYFTFSEFPCYQNVIVCFLNTLKTIF